MSRKKKVLVIISIIATILILVFFIDWYSATQWYMLKKYDQNGLSTCRAYYSKLLDKTNVRASWNKFNYAVCSDLQGVIKIDKKLAKEVLSRISKAETDVQYNIHYKQSIDGKNYYIIEFQECHTNLGPAPFGGGGRLCNTEEYFVLDNKLNSYPVLYGHDFAQKRYQIYKDNNVNQLVQNYLDKSGYELESLLAEFKLEFVNNSLYLTPTFSDTVFGGNIINGKFYFNNESVIDQTVITSFTSINECDSLKTDYLKESCRRSKAINNHDENFCIPLLGEAEQMRCFHSFAIINDSPKLCDKLDNYSGRRTSRESRPERCRQDVSLYHNRRCNEIKQELELSDKSAKRYMACSENINSRLYSLCFGTDTSLSWGHIYPEICESIGYEQSIN